jgi:hypothetical protein
LAEQVRKQAEPERWSINAVIRLAIETSLRRDRADGLSR